MKPSMKMGRMKIIGPCINVAVCPTDFQYMSTEASCPPATAASTTDLMEAPKPTRTGVPTAPKVTGKELNTRQMTAAASGGKPKESSSGAAKAAGVPKPAAPSMKAANM